MHSESDPVVPGKKVLFVDDEEALVTLGADLLGEVGYAVTCACSGHQALDLFRQQSGQFDLVVTDESMPGMTGIELAQRLYHLAPELPVILCSGHLLTMAEEGISRTNIKEVMAKTDVFYKLPQVMELIFSSGSNRTGR